MAVGGEYKGRVGELCKLVQKGQCRHVTVACASDEEAGALLEEVAAWIHRNDKKAHRPLQCSRDGFEVIISR